MSSGGDVLSPSADAALAAWRNRVEIADAQAAQLRPAADPPDRWGLMASTFAPGTGAYPAPELEPLRELARPGETWLEIGAGAGRLAIPLARQVRRMSALDQSPGMIERLRAEVTAARLGNFEVLAPQVWPPADEVLIPTVDVVLAASVLFFIADLEPFLTAMEAHARRLCVAVLQQHRPDTPVEPLWSGLHGEPAAVAPALREFLAVLGARGCAFEVRLVPRALPERVGLQAALDIARRRYFVAPGSERDARLRELLEAHCRDASGRYAVPNAYRYAGVVSWRRGEA